ncbi:hypothetical protein ACHAW5_009705 [Stephanodiscus triporus]|uniref:Splicing factor YJU2 n=1 Tax=Stephanodiscus triporus TaxID=2934178 RepID=A0ABD3MSP1_9STRA
MGERKVLNKYIPADFDPKLVPRGTRPKDDLVTVRMMLPFTIQCTTCSTFLYRGRKFNSKKESMKGIEGKYLGIQRFRFYIKCSDCSRPITFLTDPKNTDYEMESGGTRNYEVWHDERKTNEEFERRIEEDEKLDSMKALENRVLESQREMAELDALEEIRAMNQRHVGLMKGGGKRMDAAEAVLRAREAVVGKPDDAADLNENGLTRDEEDLVRSIKFGSGRNNVVDDDDDDDENASGGIRRLNEEDELLAERSRLKEAERMIAAANRRERSNVPIFKVKKRRKDPPSVNEVAQVMADASTRPDERPRTKSHDDDNPGGDANVNGGGALGGLLAYGSDSD